MQQMVRIPRLTRLAREVRSDPYNIDLGMEALALAEKLYLSDLGTIVDGVVNSYSEWFPTLDEGLARYYPDSIEFSSLSVFETLIRYCFCRILILGLCRVLKEVVPFSPILDSASLAYEELRNASLIATSMQYAEKQKNPFPLGALLGILPLQVAFGTWWRVQRGDIDENTAEVDRSWEKERASFMKEWCREKSNGMLRIWNGHEKSTSRLEVQIAALEGGPLMEWMKRRITPL